MQPHNPLKESHSTFCLQRHPVTAHAILTVWGKLWGPRHECLTLTAQFSPAASCQHLRLITWRVLPVSRACSTSERGRWSAGKYSPPPPRVKVYTPRRPNPWLGLSGHWGPNRSKPQMPRALTCSMMDVSLPTLLTMLPGTTSQINHFPLSFCLTICFKRNWN